MHLALLAFSSLFRPPVSRGKNVSIVVTCLTSGLRKNGRTRTFPTRASALLFSVPAAAGGEFLDGSPPNQGPSTVSKNRLGCPLVSSAGFLHPFRLVGLVLADGDPPVPRSVCPPTWPFPTWEFPWRRLSASIRYPNLRASPSNLDPSFRSTVSFFTSMSVFGARK